MSLSADCQFEIKEQEGVWKNMKPEKKYIDSNIQIMLENVTYLLLLLRYGSSKCEILNIKIAPF